MNKITYQDIDVKDDLKHYVLTLSKNGQFISSTTDANRGKLFNNDDYHSSIAYYNKQREDKKRDLVIAQES